MGLPGRSKLHLQRVMARLNLGTAGRYVIACATGAAVCGVSVFVMLNTPPPAALAPAEEISQVPVTSQEFSDPLQVDVFVDSGPEVALRAGRDGLVTSIRCDTATAWESGSSTLTIDGGPVLNLHSSTPLWRDLIVGARGMDVAALKAELSRLGHETTDGDKLRWADIRSMRSVAAAAGLDASFDTVSFANIVWLPKPAVVPTSCDVGTGDRITSDTVLATAQSSITVRIETATSILAGDRQLEVDGLVIPLTTDLKPVDATRARDIVSTSAYRASASDAPADGNSVKIGGTLTLTSPVLVSAVPAAAVHAESVSSGCVESDIGIIAATIVSSELGATFITFDDSRSPTTISTNAPSSCG